jgi:hypothetical protein
MSSGFVEEGRGIRQHSGRYFILMTTETVCQESPLARLSIDVRTVETKKSPVEYAATLEELRGNGHARCTCNLTPRQRCEEQAKRWSKLSRNGDGRGFNVKLMTPGSLNGEDGLSAHPGRRDCPV